MKHRTHRIITWLLLSVMLLSTCTLYACEAEEPTETVPATQTEPVTEAPTEPETEPETEPVVYYVCTNKADPSGTAVRVFASLDGAITLCDRLKQQGYRVVDSNGKNAYLPYTELQCDILRESKRVTDYVRDNNFKYGDAPINPPLNHDARKVSCDRLVCWVMYNVGYVRQPNTQGVVVSAMAQWCEKQGFEQIDRVEDLQPGDIVLVRYNGHYPEHTFIHAGFVDDGSIAYRYDCGSDLRIQSTQPSKEPIFDFWRAYRPVHSRLRKDPSTLNLI